MVKPLMLDVTKEYTEGSPVGKIAFDYLGYLDYEGSLSHVPGVRFQWSVTRELLEGAEGGYYYIVGVDVIGADDCVITKLPLEPCIHLEDLDIPAHICVSLRDFCDPETLSGEIDKLLGILFANEGKLCISYIFGSPKDEDILLEASIPYLKEVNFETRTSLSSQLQWLEVKHDETDEEEWPS